MLGVWMLSAPPCSRHASVPRVRIGQRIELLSDSAEHPNLKRGALGLVSGFSRDGKVVVSWDDGLVAILDPSLESYERIGSPALSQAVSAA